MLDDLLTIPEAAEAVGYDPAALRKAAQRGRLDARKVGGSRGPYVTTRESVARYVAEVEAWRAGGRMPRNRPRHRVNVAEIMPE